MVGRNFLDAVKDTEHEVIKLPRYTSDHYLRCLFDKVKPDMVIHAAGLVRGIRANMERPYDFLYQKARF